MSAAEHETRSGDPRDFDLEMNGDRLREECGVFGIFNHEDAAAITALGLHALQHRGQEAAGIVSYDGKRFHLERRLGLVGDNFSKREVIDRLPGRAAIGHTRYSTTGHTILRNVQPWNGSNRSPHHASKRIFPNTADGVPLRSFTFRPTIRAAIISLSFLIAGPGKHAISASRFPRIHSSP